MDCLELITDILGPYYKTQDVPGLEDPIDDEDVQTICEAIQGAEWDRIESAFNMIRDASQYAWEYAALPDEGDIESAAERAAELVVDDWDFVEDPWGQHELPWLFKIQTRPGVNSLHDISQDLLHPLFHIIKETFQFW